MGLYVKVACNKCGKGLFNGEPLYCSGCYANRVRDVTALKKCNETLLNENEKLKQKLEEAKLRKNIKK